MKDLSKLMDGMDQCRDDTTPEREPILSSSYVLNMTN